MKLTDNQIIVGVILLAILSIFLSIGGLTGVTRCVHNLWEIAIFWQNYCTYDIPNYFPFGG